MTLSRNFDKATVDSFGDEWTKHNQSDLSDSELRKIFDGYFLIFPWRILPKDPVGFDMGCGSGRWARFVAQQVKHLHCIDAAEGAIAVARRNLDFLPNITFHHATTESTPFGENEFDFGYSLGVLHHIPDTQGALNDCVRLLKPGAPFLLYLYYRFDNRPWWFKVIWSASECLRKSVSRMPSILKNLTCDLIAYLIYWPVSRASLILDRMGFVVSYLPLSFYRNSSIKTLRTDSRDRFGTPLEQRFTRAEIEIMMRKAGLEAIAFSTAEPYWCAVGTKIAAKPLTEENLRSFS